MKRLNGGMKAAGGYYWNLRTWKISTIEGAQGTLEGGAEDRFVRVPMLLMIPLALVVSFVFVVFLPFIGLAMLVHALFLKALSLRDTAADAVFAPALAPGEAYFAGKPEKKTEPGAAPDQEPLAELKVEIDAARASETAQNDDAEKPTGGSHQQE